MAKQQQILKVLIKESGLSNKQFAIKHKIEVTKLCNWLNGTRGIQFCKLDLIALNEGKKITLKIEKLITRPRGPEEKI
jgi:hypothetical protein